MLDFRPIGGIGPSEQERRERLSELEKELQSTPTELLEKYVTQEDERFKQMRPFRRFFARLYYNLSREGDRYYITKRVLEERASQCMFFNL